MKNEDIKLEFISIKDKPNRPNRGIRLTHIPTGEVAEYNLSTASITNYEKALELLEIKVKKYENSI